MSRKYEQRKNIAIVFLLLALFCAGLSYLKSDGPLVALYPIKLGERDAAEVSDALTRMSIEHKLDPDIGIVLHPDDRQKAQAKLASLSLPRLQYNPPSPGPPSPESKLEAALSNRLHEFSNIDDVKVKLSMPTKTYFPNELPQSTARVFLKPAEGTTLTDTDLLKIKQLFQTTVPVIEWENVQILDSTGRQLSPRELK